MLSKLKIKQQLLNNVEEQEEKEESDDNAKAFEFVIESQRGKLGKEECKKGESDKSVREGKESGVKKMETS